MSVMFMMSVMCVYNINYTLEFYTQEVLVLNITVDLSLWILLTINVKGLP